MSYVHFPNDPYISKRREKSALGDSPHSTSFLSICLFKFACRLILDLSILHVNLIGSYMLSKYFKVTFTVYWFNNYKS